MDLYSVTLLQIVMRRKRMRNKMKKDTSNKMIHAILAVLFILVVILSATLYMQGRKLDKLNKSLANLSLPDKKGWKKWDALDKKRSFFYRRYLSTNMSRNHRDTIHHSILTTMRLIYRTFVSHSNYDLI